jgi:serine phosphatase RsbU (regulator of sigma subunit)
MRIDTGVASLALPGQRESGDLSLVKRIGHGVLAAVVDGLGHGAEAAEAAHVAVSVIDRYAKEPLAELIKRCHAALVGTRGVVLSAAVLDPAAKTMTWIGIGNVCGMLLRGDGAGKPNRVSLVTVAGFVGLEEPHIAPRTVPLARGDTLILATDGISSSFGDSLQARLAPQAMADDILTRHATRKDDALVLVARYVGG